MERAWRVVEDEKASEEEHQHLAKKYDSGLSYEFSSREKHSLLNP